MFEYTRQPWKTLYNIYVGVSIVVRLPVWIILAIIPATRPRRSWPISRTLQVWVIDTIITASFKTGLRPDPVVEGSPEETGCVWTDPIQEQFVVGEVKAMAETNNVKPVKVCGFWYGKKGSDGKYGQRAGPGERVLYYLHGELMSSYDD